jgi:hypothetical protein
VHSHGLPSASTSRLIIGGNALLPSGYKWVRCRSHDNYPVLGLAFTQGNDQSVNALLYDTGSDETYISSEILAREEIATAEYAPQLYTVNGYPLMAYWMEGITVLLHDGENTKFGSTSVVVVENWTSSAFGSGCNRPDCAIEENLTGLCIFRTGVLSNRLLADLKVALVLDGNTRTTRIMSLN